MDSISSSVDLVLSIYQNAPPNLIKNLTGKNPQEVRDLIEQLIKKFDSPPPQQQIEVLPPPPPPVVEEEPVKEIEPTNNVPLFNRNFNEYPLQFDTRNPIIPLEQILQDQMFISMDLNHQINDENREVSPDPNEYIPTMTVVNSSKLFLYSFSRFSIHLIFRY